MTGWTSLTTAEANSIRFYTDSGLTTEIAREVVSADEIWVKIPTLTSSTEIWCDYDGVRADYAVTDTYGRNAVWSSVGYGGRWHLSESSGNATDSTGNGNTGTNTNVTYSSQKIGNGAVYNGTAYHTITDASSLEPANAISFGGWLFVSSASSFQMAMAKGENAGDTRSYELRMNGTTTKPEVQMRVGTSYVQARGNTNLGTNTWKHVIYTRSGTSHAIYVDGASQTLEANTTQSGDIAYSTDDLWLGQRNGGLRWNGRLDEMYVVPSQLSANWIVTEYNNQNSPGTFWGTVVDANVVTFRPRIVVY